MDLVLDFDPKSSRTVFLKIAAALKQAIVEGRLQPGSAMPSVRQLASSLGSSRSTIIKAYNVLESQGLVVAVPGNGTFVKARLDDIDMSPPNDEAQIEVGEKVKLSSYGQRLLQAQEAAARIRDLYKSWSDYGMLPTIVPAAQWQKLIVKHCREFTIKGRQVSRDPFGYWPLRQALAEFLARSRAVRCTADQVMVFLNREQRLELICRVLLENGDRVAVENPGYFGAHHALVHQGATLVPITSDTKGLHVQELARESEPIKMVYIQPSHQEPAGAQMSIARREQLLQWAARSGSYIIEDDFDSEFRTGSNLLPSLQGMDRAGSVIYLRCFWKVLSPLVKFGFVVVPTHLVPVMQQARLNFESESMLLEQMALTDLILEGHLERHIFKTRQVHTKRRQTLIYSLTQHFGPMIAVSREVNGVCVQVRFEVGLEDDELLAIARQCRVPILSTAPYYIGRGKRGEFILPFMELDEHTCQERIKEFAARVTSRQEQLDVSPMMSGLTWTPVA
jgi:GntR family transcriptional regulator/MocR family aminotransferase